MVWIVYFNKSMKRAIKQYNKDNTSILYNIWHSIFCQKYNDNSVTWVQQNDVSRYPSLI